MKKATAKCICHLSSRDKYCTRISFMDAPLRSFSRRNHHCILPTKETSTRYRQPADVPQITTNPAFDTEPVWSPDSKQIAFASDRMGSLDVFVVSSEGGALLATDPLIQAVRNLLPTKTTNTFYSQPTLLLCRRCRVSFRPVPASVRGSRDGRTPCYVLIHANGVHLY